MKTSLISIFIIISSFLSFQKFSFETIELKTASSIPTNDYTVNIKEVLLKDIEEKEGCHNDKFFRNLKSCAKATKIAQKDVTAGCYTLLVNANSDKSIRSYQVLKYYYGVQVLFKYANTQAIKCYNEFVWKSLEKKHGVGLWKKCQTIGDSLERHSAIAIINDSYQTIVVEQLPSVSITSAKMISNEFLKKLENSEKKKLSEFSQSSTLSSNLDTAFINELYNHSIEHKGKQYTREEIKFFLQPDIGISSTFWVDESGELTRIKSKSPLFESLSLKLFAAIEKHTENWQPAIYQGKKVKVAMSFEISYKITD